MKFTSINSLFNITDDRILKGIIKGNESASLSISAYIEEDHTRHITLWISSEQTTDDDCDVYLDLDIYQAELFAKKLQSLVDDRKMFLEKKMNEL